MSSSSSLSSPQLVINSIHIITIIIISCCITNGAAIKCFVCDSSDNASCADLKSNSSLVPEECTLDKMKSLGTWLFELNKLSYFENGANKNPLMNCQKVVAKDPKTMKMVTARFCQLDTGDSDACSILRNRLRLSNDDFGQQQRRNNQRGNYGNFDNNNGQEQQKTGDGETEAEEFFCDICNTDRCNGATKVLTSIGFLALAITLMVTML